MRRWAGWNANVGVCALSDIQRTIKGQKVRPARHEAAPCLSICIRLHEVRLRPTISPARKMHAALTGLKPAPVDVTRKERNEGGC